MAAAPKLAPANADIHPDAVVCMEAELRGDHKITIGANSVLHPACIIDASSGPIVIGEGNIIEEQVRISNASAHSGKALVVGDYNLLEVRSEIRNSDIGDFNHLEVKAVLEEGNDIGDGNVICCGVRMPKNAVGLKSSTERMDLICLSSNAERRPVISRVLADAADGDSSEAYFQKHKKTLAKSIEALRESLQKCHYLMRTKPTRLGEEEEEVS